MRFNQAWLQEWVDVDTNIDKLAHQITMAGLEVDAVEPASQPFNGVVVGEVKTTEPHPDADKLTLCQVDAGGGETFPVVCGASNVRPGLKVPFARVGATLPGDFQIKSAKLRGQPSEGMLCGGSELGLEDLLDGLLELPADAPVGMDIREYLQLDDQVVEVDLTPNRADCLSIRGLAREVAVLNRLPLREPEMKPVAPQIEDTFAINISAPQACPRYLGRVIRGVDLAQPSPLWLVERLRRAGLRPVDPVVDVTNYVLLELGQPLHAFDLGKLNGEIQVRMANKAEKLTLLDGQSIELRDDSLVIADTKQVLALAGIMGGAESAVGETTTDIFLECAFFSPLALAGKARSYGLHTDSSHRFERGVDPALQEQAIERATALILEVVGGQAGPVQVQESRQDLPIPAEIELTEARVEQLLGLKIASDEIVDILARLGMRVDAAGEGAWRVLPPSWRFDMAIAEDLVEELARVYGYDRLPSELPGVAAGDSLAREALIPLRGFTDTLVARGYLEVISYSFVEPAMEKLLAPQGEPLALANPISADLSVMRTSLWAGLLGCARHNLNRQADRLRIFETGLRFRPDQQGLQQEPMLAGLLYGAVRPRHWQDERRNLDFYDLKGDVEALLGLSGGANWQFQPAEHPALHPGQSARVLRDGVPAGWLGRLHPAVASALDLPAEVLLFELESSAIEQSSVPKFGEISDQPSVRRDLALVVGEQVAAADLIASVRAACDQRLKSVQIFDVYQGPGVPEGHKSLALGLTLQERSRTLRDVEISDLISAVVSQLKQEFNASLRE